MVTVVHLFLVDRREKLDLLFVNGAQESARVVVAECGIDRKHALADVLPVLRYLRESARPRLLVFGKVSVVKEALLRHGHLLTVLWMHAVPKLLLHLLLLPVHLILRSHHKLLLRV
jgi:hypothetical protein